MPHPANLRIDFTGRDASSVSGADENRAITAFLATIAAYGADPTTADTAYREQWAEFEDETAMYGPALAWIAASGAAARAVVEGWAEPDRSEVRCEPHWG